MAAAPFGMEECTYPLALVNTSTEGFDDLLEQAYNKVLRQIAISAVLVIDMAFCDSLKRMQAMFGTKIQENTMTKRFWV